MNPTNGAAPSPVEESVDHAVNMGIEAWNTGRYAEAAQWFRDAAAHVDTVRKIEHEGEKK